MSKTSEKMSEMSFLEHLGELRKRLIYIIIFVCIGALFAFTLTEPTLAILQAPFKASFPGKSLIGTAPGEGFSLRMFIAFFVGALLVSPLIFHQLWLFIAPGLYEAERRLVIPFILASTSLFLAGVYFSYELVLPIALAFFKDQYDVLDVSPEIRITEYLSLIMKTMLGLGLVFEMPVIAYFLKRLDLITHRTLIDGGRYAIVIIFIVAGVLSPPDVMSQFLIAAPLLLLYGVSILIVKFTKSA